jgi:hypothetical protein
MAVFLFCANDKAGKLGDVCLWPVSTFAATQRYVGNWGLDP